MHSNNFQDLTGMIFGCYEVINEAPPQISSKGKIRIIWHCRCIHCGFEKDIAANHIKRRPNVCLNCSKKKTTFEDLSKQIFGYIRVDDRAPDVPKGNGKFRTMWNVTCLACGRKKVMPASLIKSGKQDSCGCMGLERRKQKRTIDFTGQIVGRLYVESRADDYKKPSGGGDRRWNCLCECGERCLKTTTYLQNSVCPSCGCWKSEITSKNKSSDLVGQTFEYLYVFERAGTQRTNGDNPKAKYLCLCLNCGGHKEVTGHDLVTGNTKSCGCVKSFGEIAVRKELVKRNIKYSTSYWFKGLYVTSPNHPLLFDFAIFDNDNNLQYLIEYQGIQHYQNTSGNNELMFGKQQREITDGIKKEYCKAHGIALYEIKYDEVIPEAIDRIIATHANFVPSSEKSEKV